MRSGIIGLVVLFLALAALYNAVIPLGEGPDEPGHLAYVLFLSREGRLPLLGRPGEPGELPGEGHQPPLAYLLAVPAVAWLSPEDRRLSMSANPGFLWAGGDEAAAFRRGSREHWPWQGLSLAWHLARGVSALAGAATVALTYLAALRARPGDRAFATLAAALVALNPQFLFISSLVSNDPLLAALGAALLWLCLAWRDVRGAAPLAGLLFGLAILTKQSALLLGPLLLWAGWRAAGGDLRRAGLHTLGWGLTALAVSGWWFLRNLRQTGDLFGLGSFSAEFAGQPFVIRDPAAWVGGLSQLFASYWGRFGWMSLPAPGWWAWAYGALCLAAVAGWAAAGRRGVARAPGMRPPTRPPTQHAASLQAGMAFVWVVAFALTAGLVAWQGRMLFPAVGAIGLLVAGGLRQLPLGRRGLVALGVGLAALALYAPLGLIGPAYRWDVLRPQEALAGLGNPTYARYAQSWERGVELRGWRIEGDPRPGATITLGLTWHSLEVVPKNWTVFVHVVDPVDQRIVAESNQRPLQETRPFQTWTPGDWQRDPHAIALPADLRPGRYELRVGLYRADTDGRRQAVWAEDGSRIGDYAAVGQIEVR